MAIEISSLTFYSAPWDGPTAGVVQVRGHTYELRDTGFGRYRATEIPDDEMERYGSHMIEMSPEATNLNLNEVVDALCRAFEGVSGTP